MRDQGPVPLSAVRLYLAPGCELCARARGELEQLRVELGFELAEIDIAGDPELERAYRAWIPVIEVEGERICVYRVEERPLREALARLEPPQRS